MSENKYIKSTCNFSLIEGDKFHENEKVCTHPNCRYTLYLKFDVYSTHSMGHLSGLTGHLSENKWTFEQRKSGHLSKMKSNPFEQITWIFSSFQKSFLML